MMIRKCFAAVVVSVVVMMAGCAGMPLPGLAVDPYEGLSQLKKDNLQLRELNKIRVHNNELEAYLAGVLAELYSSDLLTEKNIRIALVADQNPGAAVWPDGLIIWNLGSFWALESEDEVAAMLAHEMTHLTAGHHETSATSSLVDRLMAAGETAVVFSGAGSIAELLVATDSVRWASDSVLFPSFTREEETEADMEAARVLVSAGYNADAVRIILGKLREFYGDKKEFVAQKMLHITEEQQGSTTKTNFKIDTEAVIGSLKGYVQNRWGQQYDSFTERESAVRNVLMAEYPQRPRGQFLSMTYKSVVERKETKSWLGAHKTGFEAAAIDIEDEKDFQTFRSTVQNLMADTQTSEVFDYHMLLNVAMRNEMAEQVARIGLHLISLEQATLEHYLLVGSYQRNSSEYERALAIFEIADNTFSSSHDQTLVPLILATKDDAGISQGSTALRCLDPSLTMACMKRK